MQQAQDQIQKKLSDINLLDLDQPAPINNNNPFFNSNQNTNNTNTGFNNPFNNSASHQIDLL